MKILLAIHPAGLNTQTFYTFWERQIKKDKNTFLLYFHSSRNFSKMTRLNIREAPVSLKKNSVAILPRRSKKGESVATETFPPYESSLSRVLERLKKKLGSRERIEVISFGGDASLCYKGINLSAHRKIQEAFGRKRVVRNRTFLPLVYGRPKRAFPPFLYSSIKKAPSTERKKPGRRFAK